MHSPSPRSNLIGISSAIGASLFFSFNDMAIKLISGDYALYQVVLIRSIIGMTIMLAIIVPLDGGLKVLRTKRLPIHLLRGMCVVIANMTFFLALAALPLADAVAIFFIAPVLITVFSVIFLGEHVGPLRGGAVVVGFIGVIIMMRPGSGSFQIAALLPLLAATFYAGLHILTRKIGGTERASTMIFYITVTFLVVSITMGLLAGDGRYAGSDDASLDFLLRAWVWPAPQDYPVLLGIGVASTLGGFLISQAYRLCEAGLAAPFEYTGLVLAIFWGVVVFGQWPDATVWIGVTLIVGSGIFMLWREGVVKARNSRSRPTRIG